MKKYDLIVIGGGFSGCAAAIAAARCGMSVLLAEKSNAPGGAANNCLVNPFMPYRTNIGGKTVDLSAGFFKEITDELAKCGAFKDKKTAAETSVFDDEYLKLILNRMLIKEGVDLLFQCSLYDAVTCGDKITALKFACVSGSITIEAERFIDASGDGILAYVSGCPYRLGREGDSLCQPMTLCFRVGNVDLEKYREERPLINPLYKKYREEGRIKNIREDVLIFNTVHAGMLHFNSTRIVRKNPTDVFDVTRAEIEAREQAFELMSFLKENFEAFKNAEIIYTAAQIGVRESRMFEGEYTLTGEDLTECRRFKDSIALGNYDIDIHNPEGTGTSHYYFKDGEYYTIPYRCMVVKKYKNLLVTGRCISTTHEAQASIRIMPIVCCLGEAAGYGAAVAWKNGSSMKDADIAEIQKLIKENGGFC